MPRFTIKALMIAVLVVAGLLALFRTVGENLYLPGFLFQVGPIAVGLTLGSLVWLGVRRRPRLAAWVLAISAGLLNGGVALVGIYLYSLGGIILWFLIGAVLTPVVVAAGVARARASRPGSASAGSWAIVMTAAALPFSMMATCWPLRLAVLVSRPALERLADRVAAGEALAEPEWAGVYRIVATASQPTNGNVALIIDANPSGRSGFVRGDAATRAYGPMSNLNFDEPVGGRWSYQNED